MLENASHKVLIISSFELDWIRARDEGKNFLGQSPNKYQYNIKQTSDENEEKLSIRGLLVDTKFLRIVHHKNCMADSNKNY